MTSDAPWSSEVQMWPYNTDILFEPLKQRKKKIRGQERPGDSKIKESETKRRPTNE